MADGDLQLEEELKELIIKCCNLEGDEAAEELTYDEVLFGSTSNIGLDSLDAVEIVFNIQKKYGVRIANQEESRAAMTSINTLAEFIRSNRD